jgi:hypothetical protein
MINIAKSVKKGSGRAPGMNWWRESEFVSDKIM